MVAARFCKVWLESNDLANEINSKLFPVRASHDNAK